MYPTTIIEWLTLALVVITAFYAWATFRILRANEAVVAAMGQQSEAQYRPYVTVSVFPRMGTNLLCLLIKNTGRSPASALQLSLDRDFYFNAERRPDRNLKTLAAFSKQIASLPPNSELMFNLGTGPVIFLSQSDPTTSPLMFTVKAEYSYDRTSFAEQTAVDLNPFLMTSVPQDPVAEAIDRLRKSVDDFSRKVGGV